MSMTKIRLGLTKVATARVADTVVVCEPDWHSIAAAAANKLKLQPKQIRRLLLKSPVREHAAGTELPQGDCSLLLCNDALIYISTSSAPAENTKHAALNDAQPPALPEWGECAIGVIRPVADDSPANSQINIGDMAMDASDGPNMAYANTNKWPRPRQLNFHLD